MAILVDAYGRPIEREQLTRELAAPTLAGVRTVWTDQMAAGLTPQRLAGLLQDAAEGNHDRYLTLAEEMEERNLHYSAELAKRKLAVSRLPLTVEAYSDNKTDKDLADAVRDVVRRPGTRSMIKNLLDGIAKGFSVVEILWDRTGPRWLPNYRWRDPRYFQWDLVSRSELRLRDESNMAEGIPLAPSKFIVHIPVFKSGIPIRNGLARLAAWAFMCSGYTVKDWMAFAEVFGMPLRMGKYQASAQKSDIDILKMAVANLGSDAAAVFPDSMMIELVEAGKSSGANEFFKILAEYMDNLLSKAILGQTSSAGGPPGKLGEEKLQSEGRDDIRDDDAEQVEETLNRDLVRPFIDLNFGPQKNYPVILLRAVEKEDVASLADALNKLVPLGLKVEQSVVRDKLGLPDPPKGAELLSAPGAAQPAQDELTVKKEKDTAANRETHACPSCGMSLNRETEDGEDAVDVLVVEALEDWEPVVKPLLTPLASLVDELVQSGGTLEDLLDRLASLYPEQNDEQLIASLASAMLKARAMGNATDDV
jgi:phage gp29-like protein